MSTQPNSNPLHIEEFIDVEAFTAEIGADLNDLNEAMRTLPARAAYYSMRAASARTQAARIENLVKATEAMLKKEHRKKLTEAALEIAEAEGGKPERVTAEMVEAAVFTDLRMTRLLAIQLHADEVKTVCQVAADAFRTRRDMLKSLGHLATEQMRSAMRINSSDADAINNYRQRRAQRGGGSIPGESSTGS